MNVRPAQHYAFALPLRFCGILLPLLLCVILPAGIFAQAGRADSLEEQGDGAAAEQYLQWAEQAIAENRWPHALAALERAADFAGVSSDLSYLLALARSHEDKNRRLVLEALERSLETNRWVRYSESQARLLEADQLIALRNYSGALAALDKTQAAADAAVLRLAALAGLVARAAGNALPGGAALPSSWEFRRRIIETLDRYPRDPRPLRIFFDYARRIMPGEADIALMELALRRLPFLLETDPELGWMAAPFIRDAAEARRLVAAYRSGGLKQFQSEDFRPNPASIPLALNFGLIDDDTAAAELFAPRPGQDIDRDLIIAVANQLRSETGRNLFVEKLLSFTGVISADEDRDGHHESRAVYRSGIIQEYTYDADQDGLADLFMLFHAGSPQWAEQTALPDAASPEDDYRLRALVLWESYPMVQRVMLKEIIYFPAPGAFQFAPVRFVEIAATGTYAGLLYPEPDPHLPRIGRRSLVSFSALIQRAGTEFEGSVERITIERGIPLRAEETLDGQLVSVTEFEDGWPLLQRLDMDLDSRMETVRRFRKTSLPPDPLDYRSLIESAESDWNGDGIFEYAELYREDGSVVCSWDMDGDGIREYSEIKTGNEKNGTEIK
jgi:hypothetical protein